jgi:membrane protease YdiL (CAAX protease family)
LPPQGLLPEAGWGWRPALLGLLVALGPSLVLSLMSPGSSDDAGAQITAATAIALIVSSIIMYAWQTGSAWFFSLRTSGERLAAWGFRRPTAAYFWVVPLALIVVYVVAYVHDILVNPEPQALLSQFPHTAAGAALLTLLAVVLAPLFEELFFRGFLFRGLARSWGWPIGAVVSGAVFGAVHQQLTVFVPLFALGVALAWVYQRTGSLWTAITLHAVFNGLSVVAWVVAG